MTNITRRKAIAWGLGTASAMMISPVGSLLAAPSSPGTGAPPEWPNAGNEDRRARFQSTTAPAPHESEFRTSFIKSKLRTASLLPGLSPGARHRAVQEVVAKLGPEAAPLVDQPIPGGVGYGIFYTPEFKAAWGQGTALAFDIVCPQSPGGNVDTFLYLTATNRSALGVEAFVLYYAQNEPRFLVFDWAQAATMPWQTNVPFSELQDYLAPDAKSDNAPQHLTVWNSTSAVGGGQYRNEVLLYNRVRHGWDLVYQYDYPATDALQKEGWIGSWSPIVETFQPSYADTRPMGARHTLLRGADADGVWQDWKLLKASDSTVRQDDVGFRLRSLSPNFGFIVTS